MINVVFLGYGNLNHHLCQAFNKEEGVTVIQVFNRSSIKFPATLGGIHFTNDISKLKVADVYIIGIPDDAISSFSVGLPLKNKLIVHTSGGAGMDSLSYQNRRGVFYPLQTFSRQRAVDFTNIPICLEAENSVDFNLLKKLGLSISKNVVEISSEKRVKLHLAAVFVNNFVNYLYAIGSDILKEEDLPFDLLKPLILETASKIENLTPEEAQTGPARRNDVKTIEKHLHLLENSTYKRFYELFTEALKK